MIASMSDRGILQDQIDYYRARAGEYDEWWFRTGRYDRGPEFNACWRKEVATAKDHVLPGRDAGIVTRRLNDGREFRIVKLFWEPQALATRLGALGWSTELAQTPSYFIHGHARPL